MFQVNQVVTLKEKLEPLGETARIPGNIFRVVRLNSLNKINDRSIFEVQQLSKKFTFDQFEDHYQPIKNKGQNVYFKSSNL